MVRGRTPQKRLSRQRASCMGENATIGARGRYFETKRAEDPDSVKTAMTFMFNSSAAWQMASAMVSLIGKSAEIAGRGKDVTLASASRMMRSIITTDSSG